MSETTNRSLTEAMDEIYNLCQEAMLWQGMNEHSSAEEKYGGGGIYAKSKFNFELIQEIQKITERFDE